MVTLHGKFISFENASGCTAMAKVKLNVLLPSHSKSLIAQQLVSHLSTAGTSVISLASKGTTTEDEVSVDTLSTVPRGDWS